MQIDLWPIERVIPYHRNPRVNDSAVEAVAASIREFGFRQPIVVDTEGVIVVGHTRWKAAQKLGLMQVPVHIATDLTPEQIKAYRIADNKLNELAEWDETLLPLELADLQLLNFDLSLLGFSPDELSEWLDPGVRDGQCDPDDVPASPDVATTKPGDLWILGDHRLLCGDSTKAADVTRLLEGRRPLLMVTDPPYGVEYNPEWRHDSGLNNSDRTGKVTNDDRVDWTEAYALFRGDVCYIWHAGRFAAELATGLTASGFEVRTQIIWRKPRFAISRGHYHWQHEPCWYAVRKGRSAHWTGDRSQTTVWDIAAKDGTGETRHGTQKPVECMARPIRNHGRIGDEVYDPFLGSGTTIIAAEQLRRRCYGLEIDPAYCDVIVRRYEQFTGKKAERIDAPS
jgi:DNA modification methylase